jgi:hypothetical protein
VLHENGLTYTADVGAGRSGRPWDLDFVPMLIGADEWRSLEQGLIQRAGLLNAVLPDLYGRQTLLRDGHLPAPWCSALPAPLRWAARAHGRFLQVYAADLGRGTKRRITRFGGLPTINLPGTYSADSSRRVTARLRLPTERRRISSSSRFFIAASYAKRLEPGRFIWLQSK